MERGKSSVGRGGKGKTQQYPTDIFALGSKSSRPEPAESKRPGLHSKSGSSHAVQGGERKRDGTTSGVVPSTLATKKSKLALKTPPPPGEAWEMVASSDWDSGTGGAELAPLVLEAADADEADRVVGLLCGAIRHLRTSQRSKASPAAVSSSSASVGISPSPQQDILLYVSLLYIGKVRPSLFAVDVVCHALCSLLRKDPHASGSTPVVGGVTPSLPPFKVKVNPSVPILAANLLLRGFQEKKTWPETFLKLYVEDSIGDRIWVDAEECRAFVDNILTAIDTKATPLHSRPLLGPGMAPPDQIPLTLPLGRTEGCSSPSIVVPDEDIGLPSEGSGEISSIIGGAGVSEGSREKVDIAVIPRYANSSEAIEQIVMDAVREQLNRRQPPENITRNFLRLLTATAGLVEVRLTVASRLEMWLQNPKLTRPAQELLLCVCTNCSSHSQKDVEVISHLVKIRLKTKALIHLYLGGIRELIGAHADNLMTVLKHTIYNELSTARNPNNMAMIAVIFQTAPEQAASLLAEIFQRYECVRAQCPILQPWCDECDSPLSVRHILMECDEYQNARARLSIGMDLGHILGNHPDAVNKDLLMNREDYHRPLRALLREVVRVLRHDVDLGALARSLMRERSPPSTLGTPSGEIEHRERMFVAVVDLVALCVFLAVSPNVREAANLIARGDRREIKVIQAFQMQVAKIQRDAVWWLHETVPRMYRPGTSEFVHALHKVLFMEQPEQYYKWDGWPLENERPLLLRLAAEVPVLQNTLIRIFVIGLSKEHPLSAPDTLELGDQLVKRAAALAAAIDISPCTVLPHPPYTMLYADKLEIIDLIFNLSAYHHPENINLPPGYCPPQLAISNLYWKAWVMLLIISAHNPSTFGSIAWEKYPTLRTFMEMCITNHFTYPPPTMGGSEAIEEARTKELQTASLEKQRILEFESHLAAASTKMAITEQTSLLLSQLITMDPTGTPRKPPNSVLDQLRSLNSTHRMGHLLCRSRRPDFLLDVIQRQGTSQSMPWLADLVESSDGAFSHLPVQCLCEFLLSDAMAAADEGSVALGEGVDSGQGSSRAREKHHKQLHLLRHLQALLQGSGAEEGLEITEGEAQDSQAACEVLEYFLRRLSSQQASSRAQAIKGLKLVLNPVGHEDEEPMEVEGEATSVSALAGQRVVSSGVAHVDDISPSNKGVPGAAPRVVQHGWLLTRLPQLLHFPRVRPGVVTALRQACQVENDPTLVDAYIQFLAVNTAHDDLTEMSDVVVDMAQLIVERSTIIGAILPPVGEDCHFSQMTRTGTDRGAEAPGSAALHALSVIFHSYLEKVRRDAALRRSGAAGAGANGNEACYPWSESMDQILVTWSSGEECTLHILVVQAIIILLTYGPGQDVELFESLLDAWFPLPPNEPPRAFLVDTSEEALLAPDWLKLRMIRSPVERLVDAALQDLDPSQLVLFIQSFGIPIASMSKLLHTLDTAVETDRFAVGEAVLDKTYMAQLVQVQRHRGATGGHKFVQVLQLQEPRLPDVTHIACSTTHKKLPSMASLSQVHLLQHQGTASLLKPEDVPPLLSQLYSPLGTDSEGGHSAFRTLQKALAAERQTGRGELLKATIIYNLDKILSHSEQFGNLAQCIMAVPQYSCPLFRLLLLPLSEATTSKELIDAQYRICSTILRVSNVYNVDSPLNGILQKFIMNPKRAQPGGQHKKLHQDLDPVKDLQNIPLLQLERHGKWILEEGLQKRHTSELVEAMAKLLLDQEKKATQPNEGMRTGLHVDWLATFEPEMIGSCPELQMQILFSKPDQELKSLIHIKQEFMGDSGQDYDSFRGKQMKKGDRSFRPYLLTLLAHQAGWATLHKCVACFLEKCNISYDPGAVLDFLWALMSNPKLWQGREKLTPKHYTSEDILGLTRHQLFTLVEYIVEEATSLKPRESAVSNKAEDSEKLSTLCTQGGDEIENDEELICRRMPLLLQCACEDSAKLGAVASHLASLAIAMDVKSASAIAESQQITDHQKDVSRAAQRLLIQLYLRAPSVLKRVGGSWCSIGDEHVLDEGNSCGLIDGTQISEWSSSTLDAMSHTLLTALGATNSAKDWSRRSQEYELSARKMASVHPLLVLRQLPMLGASLHGRVHLDWGVFRSRNHLTLFQQVLGLLELLRPRIFALEHSSGLEDTLDAFFALFAHHGLMKDVVVMLVRVVALIQGFISYDAQRALKYLQKHANVLNDLQLSHPNLPSLRALLSGISLPKLDGGENGRGGEVLLTAIAPIQPAVEPSLPYWSQAQLVPLLSKLEKSNGEDVLAALQELEHASLRRPSLLDPFMESVCQLVLNLSGSIRTLALTLLLRHLRHSPPSSASPSPVLASFVRCLDHSNPPDVLLSALDRLPDVVVCAQEHALMLLQKAFNLGMYSYINTAPHISKAISMLNVQSGY